MDEDGLECVRIVGTDDDGAAAAAAATGLNALNAAEVLALVADGSIGIISMTVIPSSSFPLLLSLHAIDIGAL